MSGDPPSAFYKTKAALSKTTELSHVAPDVEMCLAVDASAVGIGAVLQQKDSGSLKSFFFSPKAGGETILNLHRPQNTRWRIPVEFGEVFPKRGETSMWSYASHGAQCDVTTSHSTCCGCCVRDYHICFRLFAFVKSFRAHAVFERSTKGG